MPAISVVIPTFNRRHKLGLTLAGLETACAGIEAEVLVVIDPEEPDAEGIAADLAASELRSSLLLRRRPGAAAARNEGWRRASSPLILFLDDDVVPDRSLVLRHLEAHRANPEVEVGVLGRLRWAPGLRVTTLMRWLEHGIQFDYPNIVGTNAGWGRFYTANISVKREAVERVGGFDDKTFPFMYEDLDLGYRLHQQLGFKLIYEPQALGNHLHATDLGKWRDRVRRIAIAEQTFCRLHPDVEPYFHRLFSDALAQRPARGRGRHLIRFIPRDMPLLGRYSWASAHLYFAQALAPGFLDAWEHGEGHAPEQDDLRVP